MRIVNAKKEVRVHPAWLTERFGDHYAQISADTGLRLKSSAKDVSRAIHGKVLPIVEVLSKKFEIPPQGVSDKDFVFGYEDNGEHVKGSIETDEALKEYIRLFPKEWEIVQGCLGLVRQKSRHASAFVISNVPVSDFIPTQNISGYRVTQYTMNSAEAAGALKMDFLVINSLNDIRDCIRLIQKRSGVAVPKNATIADRRVPWMRLVPYKGELVDIWALPEEQLVFHDIVEGRTETVFQFSTNSALQWLKEFNGWKNEAEERKAIDSIAEMAAFTALDRPGPLDADVTAEDGTKHNMLVEYARRARGEAPTGFIPALYELIPETHGILVFQESLEKVYKALMGCTGAEAETFRKNIAKKKMDKVLKAKGPWMEKVSERYDPDTAEQVWSQIVTFGEYGFCKAHAVSYCFVSYACAWLKHHFPLEWWASVLRNAGKNEINEVFWRHCGHLIDPPDIKLSGEFFEIRSERIRAPLSLLKGVGPEATRLLAELGPYTDIENFCKQNEDWVLANSTQALDKEGKPAFVEKGPKGKKYKIPKIKRATSPLNSGVVYKLIISGTLDSLFPETVLDTPILLEDKLRLCEAALAKAKNKKNPDAVEAEYVGLNRLKLYQMRKEVLPAYSIPLLPLLAQTHHPVLKTKVNEDGRKVGHIDWSDMEVQCYSPQAMRALNNIDPFPENTKFWVTMPAYVISQRLFSYQGGKEACDLELDIDGERLKFVKWPDKQGKLPAIFKTGLSGALLMVILSKYRADRPFGLEDIVIVESAIPKNKKESKNDNDE